MSGPLPNDAYWVTPGRLMAGPYAGAEQEDDAIAKLNGLTQAGVTEFLDLTEEGEVNHYGIPLTPYEPLIARINSAGEKPIGYKRMPIRDVHVPSLETMRQTLDHLSDSLDDGAVVYVHCWGGTGRTGTVIGCHLIETGVENEKVIEHIAGLRTRLKKADWPSPETPEQVEFVEHWAD